MIAYKFLSAGAVGSFSGQAWPTPGAWFETDGPVEPCVRGIHACPLDALAYWLDDELWKIELDREIRDEGTVLVARRARLLTRVERWPAVSSIFASACAQRAVDLSRRSSTNPRVAQLAREATECAQGSEADGGAIVAAYAAAVAASALEAGGFERERMWQSRHLADLLGISNS